MMKLLALLILFIITSGCVQQEATNNMTVEQVVGNPDIEITKYKGIWMPFSEQMNESLKDMNNLKLDGVNIAAIGVKIEKDGNTIKESENEVDIKNAINEFHKNNIKTMLSLNPAHGTYRVSPDNTEDVSGRQLLDMHTKLVLKWAATAEQYGVEMFCPLVEPQLLSYENEKDVSDWAQEILPRIKEVYDGKLCFNAHGNAEGLSEYNLSGYDYVVNAGLTCTTDIYKRPDIINSINANHLTNIKNAYPEHKFIYFAVGAFTGPDHQFWEPIAPANMVNNSLGLPVDFFTVSEQGQAACYDIFFNLTWNETDGYIFTIDKGFEYRNKDAERIIRKWFG